MEQRSTKSWIAAGLAALGALFTCPKARGDTTTKVTSPKATVETKPAPTPAPGEPDRDATDGAEAVQGEVKETPPPPLAPTVEDTPPMVLEPPPDEPPARPPPLAPRRADLTPGPGNFGWDPAWIRAEPWEYAATGTLLVGAVAATQLPGQARWLGENALDTAARSAFRLDDPDARAQAKIVSDVGLGLLGALRLTDNLLVTAWARKHPDIAWQLMVMDAEAIGLATAVHGLVAGTVGRQRPYVADMCSGEAGKSLSQCQSDNQYRSFFSGHATAAFTMAGTTCIHHAQLGIYGNPIADAFACGGAMATAAGVSLLRVVSDQHNLTDVLVGAAWGTAVGVGLPWLLHYRGGGLKKSDHGESKNNVLQPRMQVMVSPGGVYLGGTF